MPSYFQKDPNEVLNYTVDYAQQLTEDGGTTISSSTWTISPSGLTQDSETESSTTATIWVSGGTEGQAYQVRNDVVTSGGQEYSRTIVVEVMTLPRP